MAEARFDDTGIGLTPGSDGWFVVNAQDAVWLTSEHYGSTAPFEGQEFWFRQFGFKISVLEPGQPNGLYHSESQQEDFLVLHGECKLLVEGEERLLRQWDFVHCPAGTEHIFVGAGEGPCAILMAGVRTEDEKLFYPTSELAAQYGASASKETSDPDEAYAGQAPWKLERPASWTDLPWAQS